jgi:hypothetical protein
MDWSANPTFSMDRRCAGKNSDVPTLYLILLSFPLVCYFRVSTYRFDS